MVYRFWRHCACVRLCGQVFVVLAVRDGKKVVMANGEKAEVIGMGMVSLCFATGEDLTLSNVLHVPSIHKCLISVSKLDIRGYEVTFRRRKTIFRKRKKIVGKGFFQGGMYRLDLNSDYEYGCPYPINNSTTDESDCASVGDSYDSLRVNDVIFLLILVVVLN